MIDIDAIRQRMDLVSPVVRAGHSLAVPVCQCRLHQTGQPAGQVGCKPMLLKEAGALAHRTGMALDENPSERRFDDAG